MRRAGYRQIFPVIEIEVGTKQGDPISIIATDLFALPGDLVDQSGIDIGTDSAAAWLEFIQPPYRAWVPEALAKELGLQRGESLSKTTPGTDTKSPSAGAPGVDGYRRRIQLYR